MDNQTDTIFVHRILEGDPNAYRHLVEKYQQMVYTIAYRILDKREDAEDAAQEIFMKCFNALKKFNGRSSFSTWLYKISYNHAIDFAKKRSRIRKTIEWEQHDEIEIREQHNSIDEKIDLKEIGIVLKTAINRLAPEEKVIVTLYYYNDMALGEIAEITGTNENNLKIKLHRIRAKLYKMLQSKNKIVSILNL